MESNKYYTPTIDEFYVGFEYYAGSKKYKFTSNFCSEDIFCRPDLLQKYIENNSYKVKYLDKEDIESLGFKKWMDRENYDLGEYQLHMNHNLNISIYDDAANLIFIGDIKNKSELKKLLKQLGI